MRSWWCPRQPASRQSGMSFCLRSRHRALKTHMIPFPLLFFASTRQRPFRFLWDAQHVVLHLRGKCPCTSCRVDLAHISSCSRLLAYNTKPYSAHFGTTYSRCLWNPPWIQTKTHQILYAERKTLTQLETDLLCIQKDPGMRQDYVHLKGVLIVTRKVQDHGKPIVQWIWREAR